VRRLLGLGISAAALAAGFVSAVPGPATAQPSGIPTFGVQFHAGWSTYTNMQRIEVLDKLQAAGVTWVRIDMGWASIQEDGRGQISEWYVDRLDFAVDAARARGMNVLGTLWGSPQWASGGPPNRPPLDPADYGWAAEWVASHFRGRVAAFEVWNEPNSTRFWTGSAARYVDVLRAAYPRFKAGDPEVKVVLGGAADKDTAWIRALYAAGAKSSFDVMAVNSYMSPSDLPPETDNGTIWTLAGVSKVLDVMADHGDGSKEIWFTEYGWSSHPNTGSEENWDRGVTQAQQADYLVRSLRYLGAHRPYVTQVFWYEERNETSGDVHEDNFGLLTAGLEEKPAYHAARAFLTGETPAPMTKTVRARSTSFFARTLTIPRGSTIKWVNVSARRHVLVRKGSWSRALSPGDAYLRTFRVKGKVSYVCRLHPAMRGTITIV
jgi:polysaccharide biosynthesis protein PslG